MLPACRRGRRSGCSRAELLHAQAELREKLAGMYSVSDAQNVFVFGFRTQVSCLLQAARLQAARADCGTCSLEEASPPALASSTTT